MRACVLARACVCVVTLYKEIHIYMHAWIIDEIRGDIMIVLDSGARVKNCWLIFFLLSFYFSTSRFYKRVVHFHFFITHDTCMFELIDHYLSICTIIYNNISGIDELQVRAVSLNFFFFFCNIQIIYLIFRLLFE